MCKLMKINTQLSTHYLKKHISLYLMSTCFVVTVCAVAPYFLGGWADKMKIPNRKGEKLRSQLIYERGQKSRWKCTLVHTYA